jgi:membrane protein
MRRVWAFVRRTVGAIIDDNVDMYAAVMAYYSFFSLFPLLLFLSAMVGLVVDRRLAMTWIMTQLYSTVPGAAIELVERTVQAVVFSPAAPGAVSAGILLTVWSGSGVFGALISALNQAYEVKETRPWWQRYLLRFACLLVVGVGVLVATVILLDGEQVVHWIGGLVGLGSLAQTIWIYTQVPLAIMFVALLLAMIYLVLPCARQRMRQVLVGASTATLLWLVATWAFRLYVQHVGAFNPAYGVIGAVMVLLTWLYYSMFVLLVGAEINAQLWLRHPA